MKLQYSAPYIPYIYHYRVNTHNGHNTDYDCTKHPESSNLHYSTISNTVNNYHRNSDSDIRDD